MKKLFILDDDIDILEMLQHILHKTYLIKAKSDAVNLKEELLEFKPDLIVMDNFIGETNAADIIAALNKQYSIQVPIVLFSATHNIAETAARAGAHGYLQKPQSIHAIRDYLKNILAP